MFDPSVETTLLIAEIFAVLRSWAGLAIPYVSLDELLSTCDFISLHAPLLPSTKHMINFDKLKIMKKGIMTHGSA